MELIVSIIIAVLQASFTLIGVYISTKNASKTAVETAVINSNARAAATEQKFKDDFEVIKKEQVEMKKQLDELSETDSCYTSLKDDVAQIKENITVMAASINQLKAESVQADALQMKTNMLMLRHAINEGYRVFKEIGSIDQKSLDSLCALGDIYLDKKSYNGNSFVEEEMNTIRNLPVE